MIINCENLHLKQKSRILFKDINMKINEGSCVSLIGKSGSGKTTLLRVILGEILVDKGQILMFDQKVDGEISSYYSQIGLVLDSIGLYERLSVYDNMYIFAQINKIRKEQILKCLNMVALEDNINQKVSTLSKGMKQRLKIARAILHNPKLLILDEPTDGLDPNNCELIYEIIDHLKRNGVTILMTSHKMEEVLKMSDDIFLLHQGILIDYENIKQLWTKKQRQNI